MSFVPKDYALPKSNSKYLKFEEGDNVIRILDKPLLGWLDWKEVDGKKSPVRTPFLDNKPEPLGKNPVKHFWALPVWDYKDETIKILEITQSSIQEVLIKLDMDEAWGSPTGYDININRTGKDLETKYTVIAKPPKQLSSEIGSKYIEMPFNIEALLTNDDPFAVKQVNDIEEVTKNDIPIDQIKF